MIIQPKVRGFICTTAHPTGCAAEVTRQINYVTAQPAFCGPKNVLIIGASTGYGLATRITAAFGGQASTVGVCYERPADDKRTATAGWYHTAAFETHAQAAGHYAKSINGDAFSEEIKARVAHLIREDLGQVDLVVYSLASPRREDPDTHVLYQSVLKPIGKPFHSKTLDPFRGEVKEVVLSPATEEEIEHTVRVMGGDDWARWIRFLQQEGLLAQGALTVAYSYIGPPLTYAIYKEGTIGQAKAHLHQTAETLNAQLAGLGGRAIIAINKALVTQASAAIPVVPLYISLLYKLMKNNQTHEGCIEQMYRLFHTLYGTSSPGDRFQNAPAGSHPVRPASHFVHLDDLEMDASIQEAIKQLWPQITSDNVYELTDITGYCHDFYRLFGFETGLHSPF